jgi:hypothetical protein
MVGFEVRPVIQEYDVGIREKARTGQSGERLLIELALGGSLPCRGSVRPMFDASDHPDGWVSMEDSPLLAGDTVGICRRPADPPASRSAEPVRESIASGMPMKGFAWGVVADSGARL